MANSEQYLTYQDYKAMGGTLDLMPFNILEYECRKKIDERTCNRLKNQEIPVEVKMCIFRMINSMSNYESQLNTISKGVESENTDGYSVKYITGSQIQEVLKSRSQELDDLIMSYLLGVIVNGEHILYLGVN